MRIILSTFLIFLAVSTMAQESNVSINGYVKDLFMLYHPKQDISEIDNNILTTNTIHNRLNFKWYTSDQITTVVEMRNRILMGSLISSYPEYQNTLGSDNGYFDLSFIPIDGGSWFMHSMIDRAYVDWSNGNWQVRVGRQRINWGINLVWNPNDVFNSFSYFDFDYEERPGTDAIKIQYYTGLTSSAELIYKLGENEKSMGLAGLFRFSKWAYDFQLMGGWIGYDYTIGGGWAGDIWGAGFRGELTHFIPRDSDSGSEKATTASFSADYTFQNSLYIHSGLLYNSHGETGKAGGRNLLFNSDMSAKYLSFAKYSLFGQVSFPINPLLSSSLSGIINPSDGSLYFGPSLGYSLHDNLELMLTGQLFYGETDSEFGDIGQLLFSRIRWSF